MDLFDLFARLGLDKTEYEQGLSEAESSAEGFSSRASGVLSTAGKVTTAALVGIGTAAVGATAAFVGGVNSVAAYGDEIDKTSQKIGLSAEAYQEWDYVLNLAGTSMDSMQMGMKTLTNQLDNARNGSEDAIAKFEQLGISMEDINTMSREELFEKAIYGFQGMADSTERAALANDLFGRSGQELTPLFNQSAEATQAQLEASRELGMVMSGDSVKAAAAFRDSLTTMQRTMGGLRNNIMSQFMPSLTTAMDGLTQIFAGNSTEGLDKLGQGIEETVSNILEQLPLIADIGTQIIESLAQGILDNIPIIIGTATDIVLTLLQGLINALPQIATGAVQLITTLVDGITKALPTLLPAAAQAVMTVATELIKQAPALLESGLQLIVSLTEGLIDSIPVIIEQLPQLIDAILTFLVESLPLIIEAGIQLFTALVEALPEIITAIVKVLPEIINSIIDTLVQLTPLIVEAGVQLFIALITNLPQIILTIVGAIPQIILAIVGGILSADSISQIIVAGAELLYNIVTGIPDILGDIGSALGAIWTKISDVVRGWWDDLKEIGKYIIEGLKEGIEDKADDVVEGLKHPIRTVKNFLGISSPSKLMREWGRYIDEGLSLGIEDEADKPTDSMIGVADDVAGVMDDLGGDISVGVNYRAGSQSLGDMLTATVRGMADNMQFVLPVYIGDEKLDEVVVNSNQRYDYIGGGRG